MLKAERHAGGILKTDSRETYPGFRVTALSTTFGTQGAPSSQLPPLMPGKADTHCGPLQLSTRRTASSRLSLSSPAATFPQNEAAKSQERW